MPDTAEYSGKYDYLEPRQACPAWHGMMYYCCLPFRTNPPNASNPKVINNGDENICMNYYENDCGGPKNAYTVLDMCCDYEWSCGPSKKGWCGDANFGGHGTHEHAEAEAEKRRMREEYDDRKRRAEERRAMVQDPGVAAAQGRG